MTTVDQELGYLEDQPYLEDAPYLTGAIKASMGMQFFVPPQEQVGMQVNIGTTATLGMQQEIQIVDAVNPIGMQALFNITQPTPIGMQALFNIANKPNPIGMQQNTNILNYLNPLGAQFTVDTISTTGMQYLLSLYNANRFRFMCEFPSRGSSNAVGTNAWGNTAGVGLNWKANSTAAGDFDVSNLNTDIVEQIWRSSTGTVTGITLDCDTEIPQGVLLDTFAMLNTNITSSATVNLIGSENDDFSTVDKIIGLTILADEDNVYHVEESLPLDGLPYWRIAIDDPGNADGFISVGTVIFGSSEVFIGECFVDEVEFELKDYAAKVPTEAFSNVSNSRAQRKTLQLEFRFLAFNLGNFSLMRRHFKFARTTLKCLYIPTPDPDSAVFTARYAMFSKMVRVPVERHKVISEEADYISFTLELDESM